jgi:hypothetical protein
MSFLYLEEFTGLMHNIETLVGESLTHHLFAWDLPFLTNNNQGSMCPDSLLYQETLVG